MTALSASLAVAAATVIVVQDARSRSFHVAFLGLLALSAIYWTLPRFVDVLRSLVTLGMLLLGLYTVLRLRHGARVEVLSDYLGLGDVLLLFVLAVVLPAETLLLTVMTGCLLGLLFHALVPAQRHLGIPFASALLLGTALTEGALTVLA